MKDILILGGESNLAKCFQGLFPEVSMPLNRDQCDITNPAQVLSQIANFPGHFVLNCAALANVELCEQAPEKCFLLNSWAVKLLNDACLKYGKKLITISSDYAVNPVNTYGQSKAQSEQVVDKKFLVVRTNFYSQKTFVMEQLLKKNKITAYDNVFFNPVSINRLATEIERHLKKTGIINIFSNKKISYLDFAKLVAIVFNRPSNLVTASQFTNKLGLAKRPLSSYIRSDIDINLKSDLTEFKSYLNIN